MSEAPMIQACRGEPVDRTPVWFMRQAGRCLPEYRALREEHSFLEVCRTPELACEVTLQPVERLGVDAAVIFSDLMTTPMAMGVEVDFAPGPVVADPVRDADDVERLRVPEPGQGAPWLGEAIRLVRGELPPDVAVVGFVGAPVTTASYLVGVEEARARTRFDRFRTFLHAEPGASERLLERLARAAAVVARDQVEAGAGAIQVFDTWAGLLSPTAWARHVVPHVRAILEAIREAGVPAIYFAGRMAGPHLATCAELGADVLSLDWRVDLDEAARELGPDVALQGNLDPAALFAPPDELDRLVRDVLRRGAGLEGHVFNLGHGVLPGTDPGRLRRVVDRVHEGIPDR